MYWAIFWVMKVQKFYGRCGKFLFRNASLSKRRFYPKAIDTHNRYFSCELRFSVEFSGRTAWHSMDRIDPIRNLTRPFGTNYKNTPVNIIYVFVFFVFSPVEWNLRHFWRTINCSSKVTQSDLWNGGGLVIYGVHVPSWLCDKWKCMG